MSQLFDKKKVEIIDEIMFYNFFVIFLCTNLELNL